MTHFSSNSASVDPDYIDNLNDQELPQEGEINGRFVTPATQFNRYKAKKKVYILAIIIGSLVVIGVGGFGGVGLLQSYGVISFPSSLQWLASAIGTIGNTPNFGSLWATCIGGVVIGSGCIVIGASLLKKLQGPLQESLTDIIKSFNHIQNAQIKASQLSRVPQQSTFEEHLQHDLDYDLNQLVTWYEELEMEDEDAHSFQAMISMIANRQTDNIYLVDNKDEFLDCMNLYLQNIIHALQDKSQSQKKLILQPLIDSSKVCCPTWYESARKLVSQLICPDNGENQVLIWVQECKEEIMLGIVQTGETKQWHSLSGARHHLGKQLGLQAINHDTWFSKSKTWFQSWIWAKQFKQRFTPQALITSIDLAMRNAIELRGDGAADMQNNFIVMLEQFLINKFHMEEGAAKNYVAEHFVDEDCVFLTELGIFMLLKSIGQL